jgi:ribokinase
MKTARIVSLGAALQDVYLIDRDDFEAAEVGDISIFGQIIIGTKVDIDKVAFSVGGGATNAAVSFARHGHQSIFIGNIGRDPAGSAIVELLDKEGIDTSYIQYLKGAKTGYSVILLDHKTGERTILTHRGASARFDNLDLNDLDLLQPDWLYATTLRGDMDTLHKYFTKCRKLGIKIMFNPGMPELENKQKFFGLCEDVDILLVNKREAKEVVPGVLLEELLSRLKNLVPIAMITDGGMGSIASDGKEVYRAGLYAGAARIRDVTGAGDAFGSGFLAHYSAGKSFRDSLVFASANAASVVQKLGAKTGILTGSESLHPMPIQRITYGRSSKKLA